MVAPAQPATAFSSVVPSGRLDRFVVLDLLGQGGMSSVLRAYDPSLDRQVAIKVMRPGRQQGRVVREAQALARMSHPNVVQVYEVGEAGEQFFIAMELVEGQSLHQWQQDVHPWRRCIEVYIQAGRGLAAAHAAGLIHRDFKPANCVLDQDGRVRVLDFGLVLRDNDDDEPAAGERPDGPDGDRGSPRDEGRPAPSSGSGREKLTQTNSILGTRAYMAPEQMAGRNIDARSDQFSFCVSLYESLCGQRPFGEDPIGELLKMAAGERVDPRPPPADRRVPRWLTRTLGRGLSARPEDRWPSMHALLAELERRSRRWGTRWAPWGLGVAAIVWTLSIRSTPDTDEPSCDQAEREVYASWSVERRQQVRFAMGATGLPYAPALWSKVEPRLDDYVDELAAARVAACEFDSTPNTAQQRCLDTLGSTLHWTISLLEQADVHTAERASDLVAGLPEIQRCVSLGLDDDDEPARSPEQAQRVGTLRGRLQQARVLERAARLQEAEREAGAVVDEAVELDDPAFLAEARLVHGLVLLTDGKIERAHENLEAAYRGAVEQGQGRTELEAATGLAYLMGVSRAQSDTGLWLASTGESLAKRHDPAGPLEAEALTVQAQVLAHRSQLTEAEERYRDALELREALHGPDDLALVVPLNGLAQVLRRQGALEQAQAHYERALALRIDALGEGHPQVAYQRINLGVVLIQQQQLDAADDQLDQARRLLETLPAAHELKAELYSNLGILRARQGRAEEGEQHLRQAIDAWEAVYGPEHPFVAQTRMSLGANLERRDRHEPAAEQYQQALEILERNESNPTNDGLRFRLLRSLAEVRHRQRRYEEAERHYLGARDALTRGGRAQSVDAARLHNRLGELRSAQGRPREALADHEAALRILDATAEAKDQPRRLLKTLVLSALAAQAVGEPDRALAWVERALALGSSLTDERSMEQIANARTIYAELTAEQARQ